MGLSASLAALRRITGDLTAVVTVADDGGSSGRLRDELGVLPPGDLRKALAALCGDDDWGQTWARVIQHRFQSQGDLHEHAVGNLLIVALWEQLGDHVQALDLVGKLLGAQGRVLPMSAVPLELQALVKGHDPARPEDVDTRARPGHGRAHPRRGAVRAPRAARPARRPRRRSPRSLDADWVVLGPGSWFSSVIPHLLVPELLDALIETKARRVLSLNLAPQPGETEGFSPQRHLEVLARHAPKLALDVVLADEAAVPDRESLADAAKRLRRRGRAGARWPRPDGAPRHDPELSGRRVRPYFSDAWKDRPMAMTAAVKDEISRLPVTRTCCRKAEVSAILRFAGGLHLVSGRIVIEAELDTGIAARRLRKDILEIFGHSSRADRDGARRAAPRHRYVVRVVAGGDQLARQTGLSTAAAARSAGLPPQVVSGATCDAEAAWRGAFLAHGSLTEPGRSSSLEVTCPGPEAALALVGAARRLADRGQGPRGARRGPGRRPGR